MNDDIRDTQNQHPARRASGDGPTPPDLPSMDAPSVRDASGHVPVEVIAAWLDAPDDFDVMDREAIAVHLSGCISCQEVAADLRGIVSALATLPRASTPRSFSLTQEMARAGVSSGIVPAVREPIRMDEMSAWYERQYRAVRWATALAAVLFVFVLSLDLVTNRLDPDRSAGDADLSGQTEMSTTGGTQGGDARFADDSGESAEESSEMENSFGDEEAAGQAQDSDVSQADDASVGATPAGGTTEEDGSTAFEVPSLEAEGESTDSTLGVKESDEIDDRSVAPQGETEVVDESSERLRIVQVGLALILVWLLAAMIALPRIRRG